MHMYIVQVQCLGIVIHITFYTYLYFLKQFGLFLTSYYIKEHK